MMRVLTKRSMQSFVDEESKTIWYYSESGFPTYLAIGHYRKQNPAYKHSIASKGYFEMLQKGEINNKRKS